MAAVPFDSLEKSKVSVSQPFATVVVTLVSTDLVASFLSSACIRTSMPATGEYTTALMIVEPAAKGITFFNQLEIPNGVPAQV